MTRVLSLKSIPKNIGRICLVEYTSLLTNQAKENHKLLSSNSYWVKGRDDCCVVTLSQWKNEEDWKKWFHSMERNKIQTQYKDVQQEFMVLSNEKFTNDDIFLL